MLRTLAIRSASSWGAALLLLVSASSSCGTTETRRPPDPVSFGGCGGCDVAGGAPALPSAGAPSSSPGGGMAQAGTADAGAPPVVRSELTLRSLSVSQTVEVPVMAGGLALPKETRALPIVAGKRGVLRAFVDVDAGFAPRPLLGVLDIRAAGREHSVVSERTIARSSAADDLASTFVFELTAEDLAGDAAYRLRVLEADTTPLARFPEAGFADLGAEERAPFRLVVVPYIANGFAPKTGEAELSSMRRRLVALLPARDVVVTLADAVPLPYAVDAEGAGWDDALDSIYELRRNAAPPADVFYYGVLAPAPSFDQYCSDGCMLGYSLIADAQTEDERGSIGVGIFADGSGDADADNTAVHELGHALGRDHAPCGIDDPKDTDPSWPDDAAHKNALIGVYGYDLDLGRLIKPRPMKDVMSYCVPAWVSDYTYAGFAERLKAIAGQQAAAFRVQAPQVLRVARIRQSGESRWLAPRSRPTARLGATAAVLDANRRVIGAVPARFARVDHGRGGYVWLADAQLRLPGAASVDLRPFGGELLAL